MLSHIIGQILAAECGIPFFNVLFLSNIREFHYKSHISKNYVLWATFWQRGSNLNYFDVIWLSNLPNLVK